MSWLGLNKKEDEIGSMRLPDLPSLPERRSLPELPSLPSSQMVNQFNNDMVKSAVVDSSGGMGDNVSNPFEASRDDYFSLMQPVQPQMPSRPKPNELVFVRIDKFQDAQRDFNDVKRKVKEIESLLREVKAINQKEDAQVGEWVKDLEKVKTLLIEIDSKVFNQL
jgi:hypothetical protein